MRLNPCGKFLPPGDLATDAELASVVFMVGTGP
jgi:hypothetical protein